ncbi:MAG TPA: hypothetical protein PLW50_00065 [Smithellaceae bacterium]|nr:hypothetical protein [Smithellaceae bacterium]
MNSPPFPKIVGMDGCYTSDYIDWATKRENYPSSSLQIDDIGSDAPIRTVGGIQYVSTYPTDSREKAESEAEEIRKVGGLAIVRSCMRNKKKYYMVWFNPDGSKDARVYVSRW